MLAGNQNTDKQEKYIVLTSERNKLRDSFGKEYGLPGTIPEIAGFGKLIFFA